MHSFHQHIFYEYYTKVVRCNFKILYCHHVCKCSYGKILYKIWKYIYNALLYKISYFSVSLGTSKYK